MEFISGGVAGIVATIFTNPLDVLKTRIQLQGELQPRGRHEVLYRNMLQAAYLIAKKEGVLALQKGLVPAVMTQGLRHGIKLGFFELMTNRGYICDRRNRIAVHRGILVSACGGGMAGFVSTPLHKVTIQLQSHGSQEIAVGHQHAYSSVRKALRDIYSQHGLRGLWKGTNANVARSVVGASAQLTTFTKAKEKLRDYEMFRDSTILTACVAGSVGVVFQTIFQTPFDVIATRLYNQEVGVNGKGVLYEGVTDCFYKIYTYEGLPGLYKGVGINYAKISRHSSIYLVIWEILKEMNNIRIDRDGPCDYPYDDVDLEA